MPLTTDIPPKNAGAFRILHFSDIHAGLVEWQWRYLLDKRLFGRLNQFLTRQRNLALDNINALAELFPKCQADLAVCTGDLTSIGSKAEFRHAEELLAPVLDAAQGRLLYVPGNHDAYVPCNLPALREAFRLLNAPLDLDELPASRVLGPVEFILLSPARPCPFWLSTGEMTDANWNKLDYILSLPAQARTRILLTHFPLAGHTGKPLSWRTKMLGWERLKEWGQKGRFQAILSGHVHVPFLWDPRQDGFWQVGAGSVTIHNSFTLIDIDCNTGAIAPQILHFQTP